MKLIGGCNVKARECMSSLLLFCTCVETYQPDNFHQEIKATQNRIRNMKSLALS